MNKAQLVEAVATKMGSRETAALAVDAVLDVIVREVVAGSGRVSVTGFGSFEKVDRPERWARNPQTGERVRVEKTSVPRFRAGQNFKDLAAGKKKLPRGKNVTAIKKAPKRYRDPQSGELIAPPLKKAVAKKVAGKRTVKKTASPKKTVARATAAKKTASKRTTTKKTTAKKAATKRTVKKTAASKRSTGK